MSTLVVAPGMTLEDVARRSTVELGVYREPDGWAVAQPRSPHTVLIEHAVHGVGLPPGPFSVIECTDGRVRRVVISPQMDVMRRSDAVLLGRMLARGFSSAGWRCDRDDVGAAIFTAAEDDVVGLWFAASWRAELALRRAVLPTRDLGDVTDASEAVWLVSLRIDQEGT